MNSKAGHRVTVSVEEQWPVWLSSSDETMQFNHRLFPERTKPNFPTFAMNLHRTSSRRVPRQIFDRDSTSFTGSRPGVIEKQDQRVVSLAKFAPPIRRLKKGVDFLFFQIANWGSPRSFEWNAANLGAPFSILGAAGPRIPSESTERGQPLISRGNGTPSGLFQMPQEIQDEAR